MDTDLANHRDISEQTVHFDWSTQSFGQPQPSLTTGWTDYFLRANSDVWSETTEFSDSSVGDGGDPYDLHEDV